ncbi:MAG: LysR family transcriptional regulator [Bradyrhizobium sp.]|nr:LysR family transcriptional regulator [Bradyrhizobium sp.]
MDVSLRQIRARLNVARTLSFTRAAAETNLSQPAVTVQIRTLEQQFGIKPFDRSSRSVALIRLGRVTSWS